MVFFSLTFPLLSAENAFSSKVKFYRNVLYALPSNLDLPGWDAIARRVAWERPAQSLVSARHESSRGTRTLPSLVAI